MNKKFSHEEGLTLIELLITLAVIAIVFAIAVPVFSNVLAGAQTSADSAQASALSAFHDEYASTDLAFANGVTTATLNGVQIASIKGDATGVAVPLFNLNDPNVDYRWNGGDFGTWSAEHPVLWLDDRGTRVNYNYVSEADAAAWINDPGNAVVPTTLPSGAVTFVGSRYTLIKYSSDPTVVGAHVLPLNF